MVTNVVSFFGSGMPEIADDCDCGFLALVFENSFKIFPGYVGVGAMLDMDNSFVAHVLSDEMFSIVVILLPVVVADQIFIPIRLLDFSANVGFNLA